MEDRVTFRNLQKEENADKSYDYSKDIMRSELLQKIKESQRRAWWNSDEYKQVATSIDRFVRLSEQEPKLDSVIPLIQAHERLGAACKTYLAAREGAVTRKGKDRLAWVSMALGLHETETEGVNCLRNRSIAKKMVREYSGKKWSDMFGDFRVPEISVNKEEVKSCKDGLSERLRIPYKGRNVYYTKSKPHSTVNSFFEQFICDIREDEIREIFAREKDVFLDRKGQARNIMKQMASATEELKDRAGVGEEVSFKAEALEVVLHFSPEVFSKDFQQALKKREVLETFYDMSSKFSELAKSNLVYHSLGIKPEQDVILNNVASSRIAALLGQSDLLAESWRAAVIIDGEKSTGVCMEEAKGIEFSIQGQKELAKIEYIDSPEFQKSISSLHLVDLLCGQIDRHESNMFYLVKDTNGHREAVGVQGIDNDVSFGNIAKIDNNEDRLLFYNDGELSLQFPVKFGRLESVVAVDSTLAVNMLSLDRPALDYALGDLIDKEQVNAVEDRLKLIKGHLWNLKANNHWIEEHQWNHSTASDMEMEDSGNYYSRAKMAIDISRRVMQETGKMGISNRSDYVTQLNSKKSL